MAIRLEAGCGIGEALAHLLAARGARVGGVLAVAIVVARTGDRLALLLDRHAPTALRVEAGQILARLADMVIREIRVQRLMRAAVTALATAARAEE